MSSFRDSRQGVGPEYGIITAGGWMLWPSERSREGRGPQPSRLPGWEEGVPDLPVAPQDEAGLTKTFQTWPRGWFHIP